MKSPFKFAYEKFITVKYKKHRRAKKHRKKKIKEHQNRVQILRTQSFSSLLSSPLSQKNKQVSNLVKYKNKFYYFPLLPYLH
jgi:hypothetical protein